MSDASTYLAAFLCGGILCLIGQILIDKTKLTPARILVLYVVVGVILGATGLYGHLVELCGAGATVPLTGFGYNLARGVSKACLLYTSVWLLQQPAAKKKGLDFPALAVL